MRRLKRKRIAEAILLQALFTVTLVTVKTMRQVT
ncbi:hypothetical protein PEC331060_03990 [Pectobacterium carotovorum subsp. carotovorum]|nr:hypothetical protein PEC331060_03990 [Pectobacterium carotovorum subsp. carotovorum]